MENKRVPELRFKGFVDEWELFKFSTFVKRANKTSNSDSLPKVEFEDIVAGEGRLNKDVSHKFDNRKGIMFNNNNILYGKLRPYLKNWLLPDFKGIALGDFWVLEPIDVDITFLYYLIQSKNFQKVANDTSGTKMPRSDWKKVSNTYFFIPKIEEQKLLGSYIKNLDNAITLHQRKLERLMAIKEMYLQSMFPEKDSSVPKMRFAYFNGDWQQCELGNIGETYSGLNGKSKDDFGHGDARFVTYMNVYSNPISDPLMLDNIEIDDKQNKVRYGDVFFTTSSETPEEVGMSSVWLYDIDNVYLNSFCFGYRPIVDINPHYLAFLLRSKEIRKKITFLAQGISRYNISKTKAMNISIPVPISEEQKKIGDFLSNLESLITLHQNKIDKLKDLKEAYLQKMFI